MRINNKKSQGKLESKINIKSGHCRCMVYAVLASCDPFQYKKWKHHFLCTRKLHEGKCWKGQDTIKFVPSSSMLYKEMLWNLFLWYTNFKHKLSSSGTFLIVESNSKNSKMYDHFELINCVDT